MKRLLTFLCWLLAAIASAEAPRETEAAASGLAPKSPENASHEDFRNSLRDLNALEMAADPAGVARYMETSARTLGLWDAMTPEDQKMFSHYLRLIHFERACILSASGDFSGAAGELRAEAEMARVRGTSLEHASKSPEGFFPGLVALQAKLTAETGSDPLAGKVGYFFAKDGDGFQAAMLVPSHELHGIPVPGMDEGETLASVYRLDKRGEQFVASVPRQLIVPNGNLPGILEHAKREVVFDPDGTLKVVPLNEKPHFPEKAPSTPN